MQRSKTLAGKEAREDLEAEIDYEIEVEVGWIIRLIQRWSKWLFGR